MQGPLLSKTEHVPTAVDSSSTGEQTSHETAEGVERRIPCTEERVWSLIDIILALVQIVVAIVFLTRAKDEHPDTAFLVWIIGYTCGCIVTLPTRFIACACSREDEFGRMVAYFFMGWVVLFSGVYAIVSSSLYEYTQHFWLCMAFLAYSCIRYAPVHPKFTGMCLNFVVIICTSSFVLHNPEKNVNLVVIAIALCIVYYVSDFVRKYT